MACFISMSLFMLACWESMWAFVAASAASILAMFSVIVVCILAIWVFNCSGFALASAGAAVTVTPGVAVTVAPGVAVTVTPGAGAGVAVGWGAGGVTVTVGAGGGVGAAFWARTGIHIRESATIDKWTGLIRFMGVLLDSALTVGEVYPLGVLRARDRRVSR